MATVPSGNAYLYTGGATLAQKLILAQSGTLESTVTATGDFHAPGSLEVIKIIAGPAAGEQEAIHIDVTCDGQDLTPPFEIPAKSAAGKYTQTYNDIAAGSVCTITETDDGTSNGKVDVDIEGDGQQVPIVAGATATGTITDTYSQPVGDLTVNKVIAGAAAGSQEAVTIHSGMQWNGPNTRLHGRSGKACGTTRTPGRGSRPIRVVW